MAGPFRIVQLEDLLREEMKFNSCSARPMDSAQDTQGPRYVFDSGGFFQRCERPMLRTFQYEETLFTSGITLIMMILFLPRMHRLPWSFSTAFRFSVLTVFRAVSFLFRTVMTFL